ncbi:MAG TPA: pectin acetylesterase-family hydrolase [Pseudobdellovibrionaceae bacterium]|jgi:hypothetical protein
MKLFLIILLASHLSYALPSGWQEIKPGGETLCARGGEFAFLVRKGDPQKIVVSFAAGGACWDDFTCDSTKIYTDTVAKTYGQVNRQAGIFDFQNKKNPYKSWTHIFIPYCTGDVHLGTSDATYTRPDNSSYVIHHRGAINTKAVLKWMMENYKTAAEINVDGCSAGSYGSVVWTPTIAENYTQARILQFGDSGAGVTPSLFFPQWGVEKALPPWIPALNPGSVQWSKLNIVDIYKAVADYYPQARFSQFNHEEDRIQTLYYAAMGGNGLEWTSRMLKNMGETSSLVGRFHYFIAPGITHCSVNNASFYSTKSDGTILSDWLSSSIAGKDSENVKCLECKTKIE